MFLTLTILPSFKLYKFWKRKTTILGGEKKNKAEKKISLRKGRREERNSIYLSFSFPIFSFCWNLLFDETRRVIVSSGQCIKKGWSEEGRAHVTSVISLLTCNNTTSCSRDPCILVSIALIHGIEIENRGGGERMGPTVEGGQGTRRARRCTVRSWSSCPLFRNDRGESMTFAYHQIDLFDRRCFFFHFSVSTWLAPSRLQNRFAKFGSPAYLASERFHSIIYFTIFSS